MYNDRTVVVIGTDEEAFVVGEAVRAFGAFLLVILAPGDRLTPFSPIRGSHVHRELPVALTSVDNDGVVDSDTTVRMATLFDEVSGSPTSAVTLTFTMLEALALARALLASSDSAGVVIIAGDLPKLCLNQNHKFAFTPVLQNVTNVADEWSTRDARLEMNSDPKLYPWYSAFSSGKAIIKQYLTQNGVPPLEGLEEVFSPVGTDCDCVAGIPHVYQVGQLAKWDGSIHRREIWDEVMDILSNELTSPKLPVEGEADA